jgi:hypothetical protein
LLSQNMHRTREPTFSRSNRENSVRGAFAMHAPRQKKRRRARGFQYVSRQVVASSCRFQLCSIRTVWISFISTFINNIGNTCRFIGETIEQYVFLCVMLLAKSYYPWRMVRKTQCRYFRRRRGWAPPKGQWWYRYYWWIWCHEWSRVSN